jgi:hypothetical protein
MKLLFFLLIICIFTSSCYTSRVVGIPIKGRKYSSCPTNNREYFFKQEGIRCTKKYKNNGKSEY